MTKINKWLPVVALWLLPTVGVAQNTQPLVVPFSMQELVARCLVDFEGQPLCQEANSGDLNAQYAISSQYYDAGSAYSDLAMSWAFYAASRGSIQAQKQLAEMFLKGRGVPIDKVQSYEWYRTAAKSGDGEALYHIGSMNMDGIGAIMDRTRGIAYLQESARANWAPAAYRLGLAFEEGEGVMVNMTQAVGFYTQAANAGIPEAQFRLARFYEEGRVLTKDNKQALILYTHAAELGHGNAQFALATLLRSEGGRLDEVIKWYREAAKAGIVGAQEQLGLILLRGDNGKAEYTEAYKWLAEAAQGGSALAEFGLGRIYEEGLGVVRNRKIAKLHYQKAVELGNISALLKLGKISLSEDKSEEALKYYQKAAGLGRMEARRQVGLMYMEGSGTKKDLVTAEKWLELAVSSGSTNAKYDLSRLYLLTKDEEKAVRLLREAAEAGVAEAQIELAARYAAGRGVEQSASKAYAWCMNVKECRPRVSYDCSRYGTMLDEHDREISLNRLKFLQENNHCSMH